MDTLSSIKQTLFTNWNLMRWLRLALGLFIAYQAIQLHDSLSGIISIFFLFQAVTNTGCCGTNSCAVPATSKKEANEHDVKYEEINSEPNRLK